MWFRVWVWGLHRVLFYYVFFGFRFGVEALGLGGWGCRLSDLEFGMEGFRALGFEVWGLMGFRRCGLLGSYSSEL